MLKNFKKRILWDKDETNKEIRDGPSEQSSVDDDVSRLMVSLENDALHKLQQDKKLTLTSSATQQFQHLLDQLLKVLEKVLYKSIIYEQTNSITFLLRSITKLFSIQVLAKKALSNGLYIFRNILHNSSLAPEYVAIFWVLITVAMDAVGEEGLKLNMSLNMEKLGVYPIFLDFLGHCTRDPSMMYPTALILEHILWILKKPLHFPNPLSIQFKMRKLIEKPSVLDSLFQFSRSDCSVIRSLSSRVLIQLLHNSDKDSCLIIQNCSRCNGGLLWTYHRLVVDLLSRGEKTTTTMNTVDMTSISPPPPTPPLFILDIVDNVTSRLPTLSPDYFEAALLSDLSSVSVESGLSRSLGSGLSSRTADTTTTVSVVATTTAITTLFLQLCMGNVENTNTVLRALPTGMQSFLTQDQLLSSITPLTADIEKYAMKMNASSTRWSLLLSALGQRMDSPMVVWSRSALEHLHTTLMNAVNAYDHMRPLRNEAWDAILLDARYPMLEALIPLCGLHLRLLLQDLEFDYASGISGSRINSNLSHDRCHYQLTGTNVRDIASATLDRAVAAADRVDTDESGSGSEEQEIVLVCTRTLMLLLLRWPEEVCEGLSLGSLLFLLKKGASQCDAFAPTALTTIVATVTATSSSSSNTATDARPENTTGTTGGDLAPVSVPVLVPSVSWRMSALWLQRCVSLLQQRLSLVPNHMKLEEVHNFCRIGGLDLLLDLLCRPVVLVALSEGGQGQEHGGRGDNVNDNQLDEHEEEGGSCCGGKGSVLVQLARFVLELVYQSSASAILLCNSMSISKLVRGMWLVSGVCTRDLLSSNTSEVIAQIIERLLTANPHALLEAVLDTDLVRVLLSGVAMASTSTSTATSSEFCGDRLLGECAAKLLSDVFRIGHELSNTQAQTQTSATFASDGSGSLKRSKVTKLVESFLEVLPPQMLRLLLSLTPSGFRHVFNCSGAITTSHYTPDLLWDRMIRRKCLSAVAPIEPLSVMTESTVMHQQEHLMDVSTEIQFYGIYLKYLARPQLCVPSNTTHLFLAPIDGLRLIQALLGIILYHIPRFSIDIEGVPHKNDLESQDSSEWNRDLLVFLCLTVLRQRWGDASVGYRARIGLDLAVYVVDTIINKLDAYLIKIKGIVEVMFANKKNDTQNKTENNGNSDDDLEFDLQSSDLKSEEWTLVLRGAAAAMICLATWMMDSTKYTETDTSVGVAGDVMMKRTITGYGLAVQLASECIKLVDVDTSSPLSTLCGAAGTLLTVTTLLLAQVAGCVFSMQEEAMLRLAVTKKTAATIIIDNNNSNNNHNEEGEGDDDVGGKAAPAAVALSSSELFFLLRSVSCQRLLVDCCQCHVASRFPVATLSALTALQLVHGLLLMARKRHILAPSLTGAFENAELCSMGLPIILLDTILGLPIRSDCTHNKRWTQHPLSYLGEQCDRDDGGESQDFSLRRTSSAESITMPVGNRAPSLHIVCAQTLGELQEGLSRHLAHRETETEEAARDLPTAVGTSASQVLMMTHLVPGECVRLLRMLVYGLKSSQELSLATADATLGAVMQHLLTPALMHTLLTDQDVGLQIVSSMTSVRRPIAIWSPDMRKQLEKILKEELHRIHTDVSSSGSTGVECQDHPWDMAELLASGRLSGLYPLLVEEVSVDGVYIALLLDPKHANDLGVRDPPRFLEELQSSLSSNRTILEHLKYSTTITHKSKGKDVVTISAQIAVKQRVLEHMLKHYPELGYSDLVVEDD
eukprot:gene5861-11836_t